MEREDQVVWAWSILPRRRMAGLEDIVFGCGFLWAASRSRGSGLFFFQLISESWDVRLRRFCYFLWSSMAKPTAL